MSLVIGCCIAHRVGFLLVLGMSASRRVKLVDSNRGWWRCIAVSLVFYMYTHFFHSILVHIWQGIDNWNSSIFVVKLFAEIDQISISLEVVLFVGVEVAVHVAFKLSDCTFIICFVWKSCSFGVLLSYDFLGVISIIIPIDCRDVLVQREDRRLCFHRPDIAIQPIWWTDAWLSIFQKDCSSKFVRYFIPTLR